MSQIERGESPYYEKQGLEKTSESQQTESGKIDNDDDENKSVGILYSYRYVAAIVYAFGQISTSIIFPTFNPITSNVASTYDVTNEAVSSVSLVYLITFTITAFPANGIIDKKGIRYGFMIGAIAIFIGAWVRTLINWNFYFALLGQIIAGLGRPFIVNSQAKLSAAWFSKQSRATVTSLLSFAVTVSLSFGLLIPGFVFGDFQFTQYQNVHGTANAIDEGKRLTINLLIYQAIAVTVLVIPGIFFIRNQPPTPPSATSGKSNLDVKKSFYDIIKNKDYILLWLVYGIFFGTFNATAVTVELFYQPFDFTDSQVGIIGAAPAFSGIFGVLCLGMILRKYPKYQLLLLSILLCSMASLLFMLAMAFTLKFGLVLFSSCINGFFFIPAVPLMLEFSVQLTYPAGQAMAVGLLFAGGQVWGVILTYVLEIQVKGKSRQQTVNGAIMMLVFYFTSFFLVVFITENLQRSKAERKISNLKDNSALKNDSDEKEDLKKPFDD